VPPTTDAAPGFRTEDPFGVHLLGAAQPATAPPDPTHGNRLPTESPAPRVTVQRRVGRAASDDGTASLVGNLLAAIDKAASKGLSSLEEHGDLGLAQTAAQQVVDRMAHLLSITAAPGGGASAKGQRHEAAYALGRVGALEEALRVKDAASANAIRAALERLDIELGSELGWSWKAEAKGRKAGGGFTRAEGVSIGRGTIAITRKRAQAVFDTRDSSAILATVTALTEDLGHARRELELALRPGDGDLMQREVLALGEDLARVETTAYQLGLGKQPELERFRDAETALRAVVGLGGDRVVWESAVPALQAIINIVSVRHEIRDGMDFDRSQAVSYYQDAPARYHRLFDEWFQITHGRVRLPSGIVAVTRGRDLIVHIDHALTATMPLINAVSAEGSPEQVAPWLDQFFDRVAAFRARAISETVQDHIQVGAEKALAEGESAVDHLDQDMQIKVASARLVAVSRQTAAVSQRIVATNAQLARAALDEFKKTIGTSALPLEVKARFESAQSIASVAQHIAGLANGIQAIVNLADPTERERLFAKEFGRTSQVGGVVGVTEIGKNLLWLVQGSIAAYSSLAAAMLAAKGQTDAAMSVLAQSAARNAPLPRVAAAVNGLNVVHGLLLVAFGEGTDRVDGAAEMAWGALGLAGRWVPRLSRFTGPLGATIAIGHFTLKHLGGLAVGALYGIIQFGLNMAYQDMQRSARFVHGTAMRLAVALESGDELGGPELAKELAAQTDGLRWNLRELGLRSYLERTRAPGGNEDPGTYRPLRNRFGPLWDASLATDEDLFTATEVFLSIVVACFMDAQQVLEEAVAASVEEHGARHG